MTTSELWDALRKVACATIPHTNATGIVMLRKKHVAQALNLIREGETQ